MNKAKPRSASQADEYFRPKLSLALKLEVAKQPLA